jgi:hypothetical protein
MTEGRCFHSLEIVFTALRTFSRFWPQWPCPLIPARQPPYGQSWKVRLGHFCGLGFRNKTIFPNKESIIANYNFCNGERAVWPNLFVKKIFLAFWENSKISCSTLPRRDRTLLTRIINQSPLCIFWVTLSNAFFQINPSWTITARAQCSDCTYV